MNASRKKILSLHALGHMQSGEHQTTAFQLAWIDTCHTLEEHYLANT